LELTRQGVEGRGGEDTPRSTDPAPRVLLGVPVAWGSQLRAVTARSWEPHATGTPRSTDPAPTTHYVTSNHFYAMRLSAPIKQRGLRHERGHCDPTRALAILGGLGKILDPKSASKPEAPKGCAFALNLYLTRDLPSVLLKLYTGKTILILHLGFANYWLRENILNLYLGFATSWP